MEIGGDSPVSNLYTYKIWFPWTRTLGTFFPGSSVIVALAPILWHSLLNSFGLIPNVSRLFTNVTYDWSTVSRTADNFIFISFVFRSLLLLTFFPPDRTVTLISIGSSFPVCNKVFPARVTSCICVMRPMNLFMPSSIVSVSWSALVRMIPASWGFNFNVLQNQNVVNSA